VVDPLKLGALTDIVKWLNIPLTISAVFHTLFGKYLLCLNIWINVDSRLNSLLLELGIMTSHVIWRIRTRKLHAKAKDEGIQFDDLPEATMYQRSTDRVAKRAVDDVEMGVPNPTEAVADAPPVGETADNNLNPGAPENDLTQSPKPRKWLFRPRRSSPVGP
jgi:hypothetical protein